MNRHAQALGKLGGKAGTGSAKARTSEQARAAVQARWKKHRQTERVKPGSLHPMVGASGPSRIRMKTIWYRRSGERVAEVHAHAVHAKRHGYPASPYAPPGMSAQPTVADAFERMTDWEWATHSGMFVGRRVEA